MPSKGQRLALIVASSDFTDATLQQLVAPGQDAADLARVLSDADVGGFETQVLINRPSHEVRREIEAFFANRKRDDLMLLYFSGHGVKDDDGRLYLATTDTQRGLFRSTAVPATFINETMTASRSRRQVLILDCCHSGAFARGMVAKGGESVDIRDRFDGRGRVVLTASNATQYAFQGDEIVGEGTRSVFTHHLVRGLETGRADLDGDGWVSLDELYDYVYDHVTDETPLQTPGKWTFDLQGEIAIARNPRPIVKPVELQRELQQAIESPFAGVREGAVRELDRLLHGSHQGLAITAHTALTDLTDDDSRRVSATAAESLAAYTKVQRLKEEQAEAEREEQERLAHEKAKAERLAAQKAEVERAAREKAKQEQLAREKAEQERLARQKAEEDRLTAQYTEGIDALTDGQWKEALHCFEELEADQPDYRDVAKQVARLRQLVVAMEQAAVQKAETERAAREKVEQERLAREKEEAKRLAAQKAEQERLAREKEEAERLAAQKAEAERAAREKAEQERLARQKAEEKQKVRPPSRPRPSTLPEGKQEAGDKKQEARSKREETQAERLAAQKDEAEHAAHEQAEQERLAHQKAEEKQEARPPSRPRPSTLPEDDRRPKPKRPRPGQLPEE